MKGVPASKNVGNLCFMQN